METRKAYQILKLLADDTRLRIIHLLNGSELSVTELCGVLGKPQSSVSKHLSRLRLAELVGDRREGAFVCYFLMPSKDTGRRNLIRAVTRGVHGLKVFREDLRRLRHCHALMLHRTHRERKGVR